MAEVSAEARIGAPAEKVWARLTDWSAHGEWNATHTSFPGGGPAELAVGGTFQENMKLMGFPAEVEWTVEEVEPARVLAIRGKGPMAVNLATRYTLTPDGDATTVRIAGEFTGAAVSLMAARLKDSATTALNESLRRLDGLLT
ncbi:SRPBCC family protein [Streptomyces sp. H51]|uniref:type II toxin-antitoxin system Rv0910 family toxin n=1 Tax=Streptomyces sp. H51 TaxID=3111770 RepID=UPI002D78EC40|nr:SRPBCC family protein [Streptomyces sp. H51]